MKTYSVWFNGKQITITDETKFFVGRCGSGKTCFGEHARLSKTTANHLIFETESGAIVKTNIDNLHMVIGKAKKENYFVSPFERNEDEYIHENVKYWNNKKVCFETK